ncbi:MAG TPA: LuxR C-terminal-related transcriptional regulator [Anaerolineaceae bacterium]|nr:LuxR C-terminal-related transcriptional regulator [Anaerolineaceae bacterium]
MTISIYDQPLLRTKISVPQTPNKYVHRPRLTGRIKQGVRVPLTLLAAPAGFGKTNLLVEWTREADLPVAWLTLDNQDNDINHFYSYFIGALQTLVPRLGEKALEFIQFTGGSNLEVGLTLLINELFTYWKEMVLVLDDFQVLENPAVLQGLDFLLKYLPSNLHLVIASRCEPNLDLAFLRAKGRMVELGADDLRFTNEEVFQYFQQATGLQLSPETVQALEERTEGWITSLQMAAISLENRSDPETLLANLHGQADCLAGYLAEEVLDRQPGEIRQFLLKSSILESLTGPLCEAVVYPDAQPGYGTAMLYRLERANLFITALNGKHEWFRYHPLFADFLRQVQAEVNPAEISELHQRAALWFEQNALLADAFRHALETRDMEWAADMIERNLQRLIKTGEISVLNQWVGKLPDEIIHRRPYLILDYAWALIAARQLELARYWLDDVRRSLNQFEKQTDTSQNIDRPGTGKVFDKDSMFFIQGRLAVCQSTLAILSGDLEQATEFSRQALRYLPEGDPYPRSLIALDDSLFFIMSGETQKAIESLRATLRIARQANNPLLMIIASGSLANTQALQGQLSKAWETLQRAQYIALGPEGTPLPLAGLVDIGLGEILLEQDLLAEARDYLERGCQVTQSMWSIGSLDGMVALARLRQAQGDISGSQAVIEEAARMALSTESSEWDNAIVAATAVRLALQRDDLSGAEQWWKKGGLPDLSGTIALEDYPYSIYEYLLVTQARFLLVRGQDTKNQHDLQRASALLGAILPAVEGFQRVTIQMEILILLAMALYTSGEDGWKKTLLRALALGEPEGFRRIFLDEGWRLSELLLQCPSEQRESGHYLPSQVFTESILEDIQHAGISRQPDQQPIKHRVSPVTATLEDGFPISLSLREIEVLKLIAEGKSNQEISGNLYLALNTVKRHTHNIYEKLEVNKRTRAVTKARQLGLIS